jgi:hypothetical protein
MQFNVINSKTTTNTLTPSVASVTAETLKVYIFLQLWYKIHSPTAAGTVIVFATAQSL